MKVVVSTKSYRDMVKAVITGDIIGSRQAADHAVESVFTELRAGAAVLGSCWGANLRFTRYRGDGWQVVVDQPQRSIDAAIYLSCRMRMTGTGLSSRLAIGIGPIDNVGVSDLSDARGLAFERSGHLLDAMSRRDRMAIKGDGVGAWQIGLVDLIEVISRGWSAAQAQVVAMLLLNQERRQDDIARELHITRQAVQARIASSNFRGLNSGLQAFRTHTFSND